MVCFTIAAFFLGWAWAPMLARVLLRRRGSSGTSDTGAVLRADAVPTAPVSAVRSRRLSARVRRVICGSAAASMAIPCWSLLEPFSCVLSVFGFVLMETVLICDLEARIIPWELCLGALAFGLPFCYSIWGSSGVLSSAALAALVLACLFLCNMASAHMRSSPAIGAGDLRLIPALCLFGGFQGSMLGMLACSMAMGIFAVLVLALKWATPRSGIPMAPGLMLWFVIGVLSAGAIPPP